MKKPQLLLALVFMSVSRLDGQEIVEITAPVVDRFLVAYNTEVMEIEKLFAADPDIRLAMAVEKCMEGSQNSAVDYQGELKRCREQASGKKGASKAEWEACVKANFPAVDKLVADYTAAAKANDNATVTRLTTRLQQIEQEATAKCGVQPGSERRRNQRPPEPTEEEREAERVANEKLSMRRQELEQQAWAALAARSKLTPRQYAILKERLLAFVMLETDRKSDYTSYTFKPTELTVLRAYRTKLRDAFRRDYPGDL